MTFPINESTPITYPGPPPQAADVVVVGGGVIGVSTALHLARAGQKVVLCEKGRIAGEQSSRNWGWIRQQGRDPDELPIMVEANAIWRQLARETNVDIGLRQVGNTYLASSQDDLDRYKSWLPHAKAAGLDTKILSRKEVAALNPDFATSYPGGMHTASDLRAEPWVAVPALAGIAQREGAILVEDCAVRGFETTQGTLSAVLTEHGPIATNRVVVAGGAWSSLLLQSQGIDIPQLSVRASVCATQVLPDIGVAGTVDTRVAWRRREDGGYTLAPAGFHELFIGRDAFRSLPKFLTQLKADPFGTLFYPSAPRGYPDAWTTPRRWDASDTSPFEKMRILNPAPNMKRLRKLVQEFGQRFPRLGPVRIKTAWAGMIDTMPDLVPVVDAAPKLDGVFIGTGMSGHGFGIGPAMGRILADLAMARAPGHDLSRFRATRFSDGSKMELGPAL